MVVVLCLQAGMRDPSATNRGEKKARRVEGRHGLFATSPLLRVFAPHKAHIQSTLNGVHSWQSLGHGDVPESIKPSGLSMPTLTEMRNTYEG